MLPSVYLETSVIGYLAARPSRDLLTAGRQQVTQDWWRMARRYYTMAVSGLVVREVSAGNPTKAAERLALLTGIRLLDASPAAEILTEDLIVHGAVPRRASDDAAHIAIAVTNSVDYLVTWNLKHIANAHQRFRIERICRDAGYSPVTICTPNDLMEAFYGSASY